MIMLEHLRSSLRYRLLAYTIPVVLLLAGLVYLAFHFVIADAVTGLARNFAEEKVRFHKEKARNPILREVSLVKLLSSSPSLIAWAMNENDAGLKDEAMNILEHSRTAFHDGNYFFVIDQSGHYYFNDRENAYANKQLRYTLTPDMPEAAWYYATKKNGHRCQINVNNTEGLKTSKVWINCLMRHDGNIIGMIGTGMDLSGFIHTAVHADQPGVTNLYINRQGAIQAAPDVAEIDFSSVSHDVPPGKTVFNLFDRSRDRTAIAGVLERMRHSPHGVETMTATIRGVPHVIGIAGIPEIGWFDVTMLNLNQLPLKRYFLPFALLFGVGMALLLVLLLWFLNRMVLSRIHRLDENIRKVEAGDYAVDSSDAIPDEIGRLSGSFFDMAVAVRDHASRLEEKVAERTADLEQSNRTKTRFLSAASHDLRQPLQALRMFTETLASYTTQNREQAKLFANIQKCQHSIQSMLDSLLDISRLDAGMLQPRLETVAVPDVFENMQSAFAPLAEAKEIALFAHCPRDACIQTDPMLIERILGNLLGNAIRYTEGGMILLASRRRGNSWRLEVRDSGAGIAEQDQASIFEEFHQLPNSERNREKGLGLGLAIVKRLCALLEHDIELRSMPGRGSTFAVTAPACTRTLASVSGAEANSVVEQPTADFQLGLVIDDDTLARDSVFSGMRAHGYTVRTAANRRQAEQLVAQGCPDFIVCDYRLPDDNGIKLIRHLWQRVGHRIPSVLLTGDTAPGMLLEAEQAGIPVVNKPSGIAALLSALRGQGFAEQ